MNLHRRAAVAVVVVAAATLAAPLAQAQGKKDSATNGMVLEPPGLDPTIAPSATSMKGSPRLVSWKSSFCLISRKLRLLIW